MYDIQVRKAYSTRRRVFCPKCGKPAKTIRKGFFGICRKCNEVWEIPEAAAEFAAYLEVRGLQP